MPIQEDDDLREKMRKMFEPIVIPEMRDSFFANWADFFVLENVVEQNRKPGLLKGNLSVIYLIII